MRAGAARPRVKQLTMGDRQNRQDGTCNSAQRTTDCGHAAVRERASQQETPRTLQIWMDNSRGGESQVRRSWGQDLKQRSNKQQVSKSGKKNSNEGGSSVGWKTKQ